MLEVETFLPLDYLQAKPLKQRLRDIREPKQVKLVYDVLKFEPPQIEKAVLFATNNALVCETPEDAMKVAYEIDRSRYDVSSWAVLLCDRIELISILFSHQALALDGTFYQKSGIISGGSHDLARKAKRWDEKHMAQLKSQKEKLAEDLKELVKKSRKGSELATVESQIKVCIRLASDSYINVVSVTHFDHRVSRIVSSTAKRIWKHRKNLFNLTRRNWKIWRLNWMPLL